MPVEVHRRADDPGSQIADAGSAETAVVVQSSQVFDDPVGRVGQHVVADGEPSPFDGVVVSAAAVSGEDVVDVLLSASLSEFEPCRPQRLLDCSPLGARRGTWGELVEVADLGFGLTDRVVRGGLLVERRQCALLT